MVEVASIVDEGLGNSSYLVDLGDGGALVVDPWRDPRPYLEAAKRRGLQVVHAVETHLHADFVSGSAELVDRGATLHAPAGSRLAIAHRPVGDGDEVDLGGLTLRALATPGHTPEHLSLLLFDGAAPAGVFTGGALIVGGIARTDLLEPAQTEPLSRAAYRSLQDRLLRLPDDLAVFPTHGPGSFCSAGSADRRTSTIGVEKRDNPLLQAESEDDFVARLLSGLGSFPGYFLRLRTVNQRGARRFAHWPPPLERLSVQQVSDAVQRGAVLVDARPIGKFAQGHVPGALSIELRPQFAVWLGWLVELHRPLAFALDAGQDRDLLVSQCLKVGHEHLIGELDGGVEAWRSAGHDMRRIPLVTADRADVRRRVLDVRQRNEWEAGHIPDAEHVELGDIPKATAALGAGPILVHCAHGQRSMTAASLLAAAGHNDLQVLDGSPADWSTVTGRTLAGLP